MALGLIFPTAGTVEVLGERIHGSDGTGGRALRRVGALVEEPSAWRFLSGRRNLEYLARAAGPPEERRARLSRIDEILRLVDLSDAAEKKVKAYSQGMRQRLGIAQALLGEPDVLMLDEPTNGLDPPGQRELRTLFRRLANGGTTVFVSSHLLAEVEAMCDRVAVLHRGRLVAEGPPAALRRTGDRVRLAVDDPVRTRHVVATLAGAEVLDEEPPPPGTVLVRLSAPATAASLNAALVSAGVEVSALVPEQASLEDVFLELVEGDGGEGGVAAHAVEGAADVPR